MSRRSIQRTIYRNALIEGVVRGNKKGFAFLERTDGRDDMFIPPDCLHSAQHGDTVLCKIERGDRVEVVKVLKRGINRLVGTLSLGAHAFLLPDDKSYYSDIHLDKVPALAKDGQKAIVRITDYDSGKSPEGVVERVLGYSGERETEILACLYTAGFQDEFPAEVLQAAERLHEEEDLEDRQDLRSLLTITIDGADARDFDDAISIARTPGDGFELWVHIADVSHYVREGDTIDREAYERATSVYFPRRVYPMLPEKLSNDLCSLVPGRDRLTLSCRMRFNSAGIRTGVHLTKGIIRSDYRTTYEEIQAILDGDEATCNRYQPLLKMVAAAHDLYSLLANRRMLLGAIDFSTQESRVLFDGEKISGVVSTKSTEANGIIEQFMIAANEAVASTLESTGYPCVYRVHGAPSEDKLRVLTAFAGCFGLAPEGRYLTEQEICDFVRSVQDTPYASVISQVAIRCMQKAVYSPENIGHYGLGSESYCHFTSPIRRYPDLMVHRLVKRFLHDKKQGARPTFSEGNEEVLTEKAEHCSERERAAEHAEREIVNYYEAVYMREHIGEEYEAVVSGVTPTMIFATLANGIEGAISLDSLRDSFYYDSLRLCVVSERRSFRMGDSIRVWVEDSNPVTRRVRFGLMEKDRRIGAPLGDVARIHHAAPKRPRPTDHKPPKGKSRGNKGGRRR